MPFSNLRIFEQGVVVHTFHPGRDWQIGVSCRQPVPGRDTLSQKSL